MTFNEFQTGVMRTASDICKANNENMLLKASKNFSTGNVDALGCIEKCLEKFKETKNTEYLLDLANYAMFRYMWPQNGEFFKHTDSDGSAGIVGMSVKEMEDFKNGRW